MSSVRDDVARDALAEFKLEVERRFGRVEKMILGGVVFNGTTAAILGLVGPSRAVEAAQVALRCLPGV